MQREDMHVYVAVDQLKGLMTFLETYRVSGLTDAITEVKEIALTMKIEPIYCEKHGIHQKK